MTMKKPTPAKRSDKVRVTVALSMAAGLAALLVLGFVIQIDGTNLWVKFGRVVTGTGPKGGGRVSMDYLRELESADDYIDYLRSELPAHAESAKLEEPAKLKETQRLLKTTCEAIASTIGTCEHASAALKQDSFDRPTPADFDARAKKLADLSSRYKDLLLQIEKKIEARPQ